MRPCFSRVGGFVNAIASSEIRALQAFSAADVDYIRIGGRHGERAHRTSRLIVKDGIPGVPKIRGFPDSAVDRGHVKNAGLMRHAGNRHGAAAAKRPDAAPTHLAKEFLIQGLTALRIAGRDCFFVGMVRKRRNSENPAKDESDFGSPMGPVRSCTTLT